MNALNIDMKIQQALKNLTTMERNKGYSAWELEFLRYYGSRIPELYKENGEVESLFNRVLLNKEVAHMFCATLSRIHELWHIEEIQHVFADALRNGDTLLIDAISFIPFYRNISTIQEAIAFNIATCPSMLFQIHIATGIGLSEHPLVKRAILDRREDILEQIRENWHNVVMALWTPYLRNDADIVRVIEEAKPLILEEINERDSMVDVCALLLQLDWIRDDPDILDALLKRIRDKTKSNHLLLEKMSESNMFESHTRLIDGLSVYRKEYRDWILGLSSG